MRLKKTYILLLLGLVLSSCATKVYQKIQIDSSVNKAIDEELSQDQQMLNIILPYKEKMDKEMNRVLSYTPVDLDKAGFNSALANLVADLTLDIVDSIYGKEYGKIDISLINSGGLRRTFTKGNLTVGNIYELMPFDNEMVLVYLNGEDIQKMIEYLVNSQVGHPVSGLVYRKDKDELTIQNQAFDKNKVYTVLTTDYLQAGGDKMYFLTKPEKKIELKMKHRDVLLTYFEKIDTIKVNMNQRIIK